jgi:serine/threonine-protein phosphatase CPPED1
MLQRSIKNSIISLLVLYLLAGTAFCQTKNPEDPWFFIQLTDPQFGMFEKNEGFEKETLLYEKAIAGVNRLKPDFIVITGDFVHSQNSELQNEEFKRITAKVDPAIPVYYSPGNHDIGVEPNKQSLKRYKKRYGKDRFSFQHKGSAFIGFNTGLIKSENEKLEKKQYKWLTSQLKKYRKADHIILFTHYPFFNQSVDEPERYSNLAPESRQKYLPLFDDSGVKAVFSGHYHNNALSRYEKVELITTSAVGKPLGDAPSGMRIVKVYSDRIEHEYFGLEEIPESVRFY